VLQISTGQIIARNTVWPVADGTAIPGLDPDYAYLEQVQDARPDYDSRMFTLQSAEVVDAEAQEIRTTWETVARPLEDVEVNVANVEVEKLEKIANDQGFKKMVTLALATLFRRVENQVLTNPEVALKKAVLARGKATWENDVRRAQIIAQLRAGANPDIDAGWTETVDETP
jgi:hypothetical protein